MAAQNMHPKVDMKAWKARRDALWGTSEERPGAIPELFRKRTASTVPGEPLSSAAASEADRDLPNLETLAQCLSIFAEKQFEFFWDGFGNHEKYRLNLSREFPPNYVFRVTLEQVGEDLEVIRRAADQRRSKKIAEKLEEADKLVWSALKPVVGPGKLVEDESPSEASASPASYEKKLLPATNVISYFQKSASIRVIPYAPVALIGAPFTAMSLPRDYLAIPHEAGHYVYRHGKVRVDEHGNVVDRVDKGELKPIPQVLGRKLLEQAERDRAMEMKALGPNLWNQAYPEWDEENPELEPFGPSPRYVRRWKEEIFADVYGCLVGGPVTALSFRDLMLQYSRSSVIQAPGEYLYGQFTEDDGVHPVPVLRPYVYTITLRAIESFSNGKLAQWANKLDEAWQALAQVQEAADFRTRYAGSGIQYVSVAPTLLEVYRVVIEILKLLPLNDFVASRWSGQDNEVTTVDELYSEFDGTRFDELIKTTKLNSAPLTCPDDLWEQWVKKEQFFPGFPDGLPNRSTTIDPGKAQRLEELEQEPRYTWNHVFLAGGWATKLPGAGGVGIVIPKNWQGTNQGGGGGSSY